MIKDILKKHWKILLAGPLLCPYISTYPTIKFHKATSLKGKLVHSKFVREFRKDPCKWLGTFTSGRCTICQYMNTRPHIMLPNGKVLKPQHFANYKTPVEIDMLQCQCQSFYIGKTKLEFCKRAGRHIKSIITANPDLPCRRHVRDRHAGKTPKNVFDNAVLLFVWFWRASSRTFSWPHVRCLELFLLVLMHPTAPFTPRHHRPQLCHNTSQLWSEHYCVESLLSKPLYKAQLAQCTVSLLLLDAGTDVKAICNPRYCNACFYIFV